MNYPEKIISQPFLPTLASLRRFECPEWFRNAKFGIWSHWGAQSVPLFAGDWYARNMYIEDSAWYCYHLRTYGHPSKFGFKDIIKLWKAENFDPDGLMDKFVAAGAKYFMGLAVHHDNFDCFESKHHRWNSVEVGPKKDIVGLWRAAADKKGLPFGLSEHLATSQTWFQVNKRHDIKGKYAGVPYDGNDPENEDLYHKNLSPGSLSTDFAWYSSDKEFYEKWFLRVKDVIDKYYPDLLYSDGGLPFGEWGMGIVAHLYNTSISKYGENRAIYTQKDGNPAVHKIGLLDMERGLKGDISTDPWQSDTPLGDWFYDFKMKYKSTEYVINTLIDIVSKNGNLMVAIPQLPDGTLDEETEYFLEEMGEWFKINGDGIYSTRPWVRFGESAEENKDKENFTEKEYEFKPTDFRFTKKGNKIYAFQMKMPEDGTALIKSFKPEAVSDVNLLGWGKVEWQMISAGLEIKLPQNFKSKFTHCFEIDLKV